jgi:hypothetical protein
MTEYAPDEEEPIERHAASVSDSNTGSQERERPTQGEQTTAKPEQGEQATTS